LGEEVKGASHLCLKGETKRTGLKRHDNMQNKKICDVRDLLGISCSKKLQTIHGGDRKRKPRLPPNKTVFEKWKEK